MSLQAIVSQMTTTGPKYRRIVGQTKTRSGYVRTAEFLNAVPWQMVVSPNAYQTYASSRSIIATIDQLDKLTPSTVQFSDSASTTSASLSWFTAYQGSLTQAQYRALTLTAASAGANTVTIGNVPTDGGGAGTAARIVLDFTARQYSTTFSTTWTGSLINLSNAPVAIGFTVASFNWSSATNARDSFINGLNAASGFSTSGWTVAAVGNTAVITRGAVGSVSVASSTMNTSAAGFGPTAGPPWSTSGTYTNGTNPTAASYLFRAGDFIQLPATGTGERYVYKVVSDVQLSASTTQTVTLHRQVIGSPATSSTINVGNDCVFKFLMAECPTYTIDSYITGGGFVKWDGNFVLQEYIIG